MEKTYFGSVKQNGKSFDLTLDADTLKSAPVNDAGYVNLAIVDRKSPGKFGETHNLVEFETGSPYNLIRLNIHRDKTLALKNDKGKITLSVFPKSEEARQKDLFKSDFNVAESTYAREVDLANKVINMVGVGDDLAMVKLLLNENKPLVSSTFLNILESNGYKAASTTKTEHYVFLAATEMNTREQRQITFVGSAYNLSDRAINKEYVGSMYMNHNQEKNFNYGSLSIERAKLHSLAGDKNTVYVNLSPMKDNSEKYSAYVTGDKDDKFAEYTLKIALDKLDTLPANDKGYVSLDVVNKMEIGTDKTNIWVYHYDAKNSSKISVGSGFSGEHRYWINNDSKQKAALSSDDQQQPTPSGSTPQNKKKVTPANEKPATKAAKPSQKQKGARGIEMEEGPY